MRGYLGGQEECRAVQMRLGRSVALLRLDKAVMATPRTVIATLWFVALYNGMAVHKCR